MGTNNVDNCARSCHAPSVAALAETLGSGSMTNSTEQITDCDCMFIIGTNPTETYPVVGMRMMQALENGSKLIVVDPRETEISKRADVFLNLKPGTDVALIMGIIRYIIDENLHDVEYIEKRCENFDEFQKSLENFDLDTVEEITGSQTGINKRSSPIICPNQTIGYILLLGNHGTLPWDR